MIERLPKSVIRIIEWVWIKALPCCEITPLISDARDRRLSIKERWRMVFHTAVCHGCRRFHKQTELIHKAIRSALTREESAGELPSDARERLNSALRGEI